MKRRGVIAALAGCVALIAQQSGTPCKPETNKECGETTATLTLSQTGTLWVSSPTTREFGGIDEHGRYYLIVKSKRRMVTRPRFIKAVLESKRLTAEVRAEVLKIIGVPINVKVFEKPEVPDVK